MSEPRAHYDAQHATPPDAVSVEEFHQAVWHAMSEEEFLQQVRSLATALGWKHYHTRRSQRSDPGFPDLVLVRDKRLIFAECKRENKEATPEQILWLYALGEAGAETYLWQPHMIDEIEEMLR